MQLRHDFALPTGLNDLIPSVIANNFANYDPITECSREALTRKWQNMEIPNNFKHAVFKSKKGKRDVHCFRSNALNPHTEIRFALGLNAVPMAYLRGIQAFNDLGFDVVLKVIPMLGREIGGTKIYPSANHEFYASENLEIDKDADADIDRIMVAHSTNGLCRLLNAASPKKAAIYEKRYIGAADVAPFLGMAGANWEFHPYYRRILACQAAFTPDKKPGETIGGQLHHQIMVRVGEPQFYSSIDDPTYRQMLELERLAEKTLAKLEKRPRCNLPSVSILPSRDSVACSKKGRKAALITGAHIHETDAWHNPIIEHPYRAISRIVLLAQKFKTMRDRQLEMGQESSRAERKAGLIPLSA